MSTPAPGPRGFTERSPRLVAASLSFSIAAGSVVVGIGCLVLAGWMFDLPILTTLLPGLASMKANAGCAFILAGASLALLHVDDSHRWVRRLAHACALAVALIGLLTLLEYVRGADLRIDQWLIQESRPPATGAAPGRMGSATALMFVLAGVALWLVGGEARGRRYAGELLALAEALLSLLAVLGYAYDLRALYAVGPYSSVPLHIGPAFFLLAMGTLTARRHGELAAIVVSDSLGGVMVRRLLPWVLLLPIALGWLSIQGEHAGLYNKEFRVPLVVLAAIVILTGLLLQNARLLHGTDLVRRRAEEEARMLNEQLEERVRERTAELEAAHEALVRKDRLATLGELAGGMSHELRGPLGVIRNAVYYLKMVLSTDERTREHLSILEREVATANRIVSGLLDFAGARPPILVPIDLNALARESVERAALPDSMNLRMSLAADLPALRVDREQVSLILANLLSNAVQAMPDGGTLTLETFRSADEVIVAIADTGSGIAPEHLGKIFDPLFSTRRGGIGLGLSIVKRLSEANGGRIAVETRVGQGSRFIVCLPVPKAEAPDRFEQGQDPSGSRS